MKRRGSQAVEFALILPVFVFLVFGGIELLWYAVDVGRVQSALVAGCKGGAQTGVNIFTDPFERAGEFITETVSRASRFNCAAGDCEIIITGSTLTSPEVLWIDCSVRVDYPTLTGLIPGMPSAIIAKSSQPVAQPIEEEDG